VIVSEFRRTQDTVRPLANRLGIPVIVVPAEEPARAAKRALAENRGGRVLIVGHSDTVPEIVRELSGIEVGPDVGSRLRHHLRGRGAAIQPGVRHATRPSLAATGARDEVLVSRDAEVREHRVLNPAVLADQVGRPPHTDPERAIHVVGLDDRLVFVDRSMKGRAYLSRKRRWLSGDCGLTPTTLRPEPRMRACRSRKSQASWVQPGVKSAGVEIHDQWAAFEQPCQPTLATVLVRQREVRGLVPTLQHGCANSRDSGPR
jgi:hypothetical protein